MSVLILCFKSLKPWHMLRCIAVLCLSLWASFAQAELDWKNAWVNAGFYTYHFEKDKKLENTNLGLGVEVPINSTYSLTAGRFHNSDNAKSNYAGVYVMPYKMAGIKIGAVVGAFNGYPNAYEGRWFPALIPVAAIEGSQFGLNVAFVPTVANKLHGGVSFQLKYRIGH
jgi:hypothetical protein